MRHAPGQGVHPVRSATVSGREALSRVPPESTEELLTALLGRDGTLEPLKRVLIKRAQGNPFFLEESVQTLENTA